MEKDDKKDDTINTGDATEHATITPLGELVSNEVGQTADCIFRVYRSAIIDYEYEIGGKKIAARKL